MLDHTLLNRTTHALHPDCQDLHELALACGCDDGYDIEERVEALRALVTTLTESHESGNDAEDEVAHVLAAVEACGAEIDRLVERATDADDVARTWRLYEEGYGYTTIVADSAEEALEEARGNVDRANYDAADDNETLVVEVGVTCELTGEAHYDDVTLDPEEPACVDDDGHDWQVPHDLVGGCEGNPRVWGHGAGVIIREVCMRCGCGKTTDTGTTNHSGGPMTRVSYEPHAYEIDEDEDEDEEEDEEDENALEDEEEDEEDENES